MAHHEIYCRFARRWRIHFADAKDGSFGFDFAGTYTKIVPNELVEYAFGDRVGVLKFAEGANGVTVSVTFDAESEHSVEQQRDGWQAILNNFVTHTEARP